MLDYQTDSMRDAIAADCALLEQSGLFDRDSYRTRAGLDATANAAEHYLLHGWKLGIEPNPDFEGGFLYPSELLHIKNPRSCDHEGPRS